MAEETRVLELPSLEQYVEMFESRYRKEASFRDMVHTYLRLSGIKVMKLNFEKRFIPSWYKRETDKLIGSYASQIYAQTREIYHMQKELEQVELAQQELRVTAQQIEVARDEFSKTSSELAAVSGVRADLLGQVASTYERSKAEEEQVAARVAAEAVRAADAQRLAKDQLQTFVRALPLLKSSGGKLQFDEETLVRKLEDILLEEILETFEEGSSGFMAKVRTSYDGLIEHWAPIETLAELPNIDWTQSAIYSRTRGFRLPKFPYLMAGQVEEKKDGKVSVDTAVCLDISASMNENNRFSVGQKTSLALSALMRRLNPKNNTYLSVFNDHVEPVSSLDLLRGVTPYDGTHTEKALDWLYATLNGKGPSIAYLITDGQPNDVALTVKAAEKFKDQPIMLRIFLIDGNKESEENIRLIGTAAGRYTRVIPVKNYVLASGVIKDLSQAIGQMQSVA